MRIYDEPVDVRRGLVGGQEAPEQFIWRDKLWVVTAVVSRWVETGAWWEQAGVAELLGVSSHDLVRASQDTSGPSMTGSPGTHRPGTHRPGTDRRSSDRRSSDRPGTHRPVATGPRLGADLLAERELWRVEAARGRLARFVGPHASGVFDLSFDWAGGRWTLAHALD